MSGHKPLPAADLSEAFGKPSRAAALRMPPKRTAGPRKAVEAVPAVSKSPHPQDAEAPQTAQTAQEPQEASPQAPVKAADGAPTQRRGRTASEDRPVSSQPAARTVQRPRRGRPPKTTSVTRPEAGRGRLVLWTPVSIRARMQSVRLHTGTLYLDQVLDALESTYDELTDLVQEATGLTPTQGRLFERAGATSSEPEQRVQLTIGGVLTSQLATIDQLVEATGAPSRSALVNAALDAALPPS